ncbi:Imm1 family immunity protein [Actinophytocola oryzae]|uniref:Immunity protein Imm1 of predicted polymorphic toxin system n=1 Tax=Actinophytocola oryzae TaxID=502181 RepID=A0A4R7W6P0_9PSEU|nr:Imm1 family immunity protein [Actinophytocola oryzae]TDV57357.1 immunity protein Imm1 of predicted polymorphic toxin system [Actinophytocola oryzae]
MTGSWHLKDETTTLNGEQALALVRRRIDDGQLETWLTHDDGRALTLVTNRARAMVMLLDGPDDPGRHAVDPDAPGEQDGYVLGNGQSDTYPDRDTVPLDQALDAVAHIVEHGEPSASVAWRSDR